MNVGGEAAGEPSRALNNETASQERHSYGFRSVSHVAMQEAVQASWAQTATDTSSSKLKKIEP